MREVSFVILAYNDAPSLPGVAAEVLSALSTLASRFELIIIDDGSRDGTAKVAKDLVLLHPEVKVVHHSCNRGVGAAFDTAMSAAKYGVLGYIDGDGQYDGAELAKLVERIDDADVVSGRRVRRADPRIRSIASIAYRILLRVLFGIEMRDINSGLKLYRRWVIENALTLGSAGAFFDAEVLIKARARNARIVEVPIQHRPRRHGRALGLTRQSVASVLESCLSPSMDPFRARTLPAALLARALRWLHGFVGPRAS